MFDPLSFLLTSPVWLAVTVFQVWMLVHALRRREWLAMPGEDAGIKVHDVHHAEEEA